MNDEKLRSFLKKARTVAIIGARDNPGRPVDRVGRYLIQAGYHVLPVHPVRKIVWGLRCYRCLADIPAPVDIVNVFRASEFCLEHAREAATLFPLPGLFWMQLGIVNGEAASLLAGQGVSVIEDACLMVECSRLLEGASSLP